MRGGSEVRTFSIKSPQMLAHPKVCMYYHSMFRLFSLLLLLFLFGKEHILAQTAPKRELRAVWIATVKNIDWPSQAGLPTESQQKEMLDLLDFHRKNGMNAVVMQIRPAADAFYDSKYEPWSEWLNGKQGKSPDPYYDPLSFIIKACHERGMEFHAWFNPYRAVVDQDSTKILAPDHISEQYPEWFLKYGKNLYFDPGEPQARLYLSQIISDVLYRYDIDGVHFDDYFYPYKIPAVPFPDTASYARYGEFFEEVDDWRRNNVDEFIRVLSRRIKSIKPWVKFGISPFGVWRNQSKDPRGSATRAGQTSYDDLYADIKKWLDQEWIDYVVPQIYFSIGYELVSYDITLEWWQKHHNARHLYIGQAAYKINNNKDTRWKDPAQIPSQIRLNRTYKDVQGSMFFSAKSFKSNPLGIVDSLQQRLFNRPALFPLMPWLGGKAPNSPNELEASSQRKGVILSWEAPLLGTKPAYYAIYRFPSKVPGSISSSEHLIDVIGASKNFYIDRTLTKVGKYTYIVTALDRLHHESGPDNPYARTKVKRKHLSGPLPGLSNIFNR